MPVKRGSGCRFDVICKADLDDVARGDHEFVYPTMHRCKLVAHPRRHY